MSEKKASPAPKPVVVSIARRDHAGDPPRTEIFEVEIGEDATLHELLLAVAARPIPRKGARVSPPAWDAHCLEGSCGGCTLRAGGRAVLACTTRIDEVVRRRGVVVLEPLGVFPVVRDLVVDHARRDRDIDAFAGAAAGAVDVARGAPPATWERVALGACIACGACLDACPEAHLAGGFVGAEAIVRNRRAHATAAERAPERSDLDAALLRPGGIAECGRAETCIDVCPVEVPIAEALDGAARVATDRLLGLRR